MRSVARVVAASLSSSRCWASDSSASALTSSAFSVRSSVGIASMIDTARAEVTLGGGHPPRPPCRRPAPAASTDRPPPSRRPKPIALCQMEG